MSAVFYPYAFPAMGSDCRVGLYADSEQQADQAADAVMAEVWRIEQKFSRYRDDSALAAINRMAQTGGSLRVDEETARLLDYAAAAYQLSDGLFDISSGLLRRVWNFASGHLPAAAAVSALLPQIGFDKIRWQAPQLTFLQPGMELDFGGIGKEYAVDRAADICLAHGLVSGLLDFAGDLRVLGPHPDGSPWTIRIRHPRQTERSLGNFSILSGAVATSGDYERMIECAGKRYGHILNPKTGWPAEGLTSVTIRADQCLLAGTLATIAMLKGAEGKSWLAQHGIVHHWVDGQLNLGGTLLLESPHNKNGALAHPV